MQTHTRIFYVLFLIVVASFTRAVPAWSQAVLVEPKRVLLDDRHLMRAVNLYNNTDDTLSYAVSWSHLRMAENGSYQNIDTVLPTDHLADTLVRFFPPEITLDPHSAQVIRLRYLRPRYAQPVESCSHLLFSEVDPGEPIEWKRRTANEKGARVMMKPLFGLSIPVIVRAEDTTLAQVKLDSLSLSPMDTDRNATIRLQVERTGTFSCYGALVIEYVSPTGQNQKLGEITNLSVFPPLPRRICSVKLSVPKDVNLDAGMIRVKYQTAADDDAPFRVFASAQLTSHVGQ